MKKSFILILAALPMLFSCGSGPEVKKEVTIKAPSVTILGEAAKHFSVADDITVNLEQENKKTASFRANVLLEKQGSAKVSDVEAILEILDRDGLTLQRLRAADMDKVLPSLNEKAGTTRNLVFRSDDPRKIKEAAVVMEKADEARLYLRLPEGAEVKEAPQFPYNPTVTNLIQYYGLRGILREYEGAYRAKSKARLKQIENRLDRIYDQIKDHPRGGRGIANKVEDWVDDQIDEIEDRVDDED